MKIISIHIGCFGGLEDFKLSFQDGFSIYKRHNEFGKSTIMAFISMMLYGSNSKSKDINSNIRKKYQPFNGRTMNGSMILEVGGIVYNIEKEFGKTYALDSVSLYNVSYSKIEEIHKGIEVGEYLLGIDQTTFNKTMFVKSSESITDSADSDKLMGKVANLSMGMEENLSIDKVLKNLELQLESIKSKRGKTGKIIEVTDRISYLKEEIKKAKEEIKEKEKDNQEREEYYKRESSRIKKIIEYMEEYEEIEGALDDKSGEYIDDKNFKINRISLIIYTFIIAMLAVGAYLYRDILENKVSNYILILAIICEIVVLLRYMYNNKKNRSIKKIASIDDEWNKKDVKLNRLKEKIDVLQEELGYNNYSIEELYSILDDFKHINAHNSTRDRLLDKYICELDSLIIEKNDLLEKYDGLKLAYDIMKETGDEIAGIVSKPLNILAGDIFSYFTNGNYEGFMVTKDYQVRVKKSGEARYREWKTLSTATAIQAYLALRISVIIQLEKALGNETIPLFMDDIFAQFDEDNKNRAIEYLRNSNRQIVLFTSN